jgi:hypothetical protein
MGATAFGDVLDRALRSAWRRRTERELLLDLGERKRWDEAEHRRAVHAAAEWLVEALLLPAMLDAPQASAEADLASIRPYGEELAAGTDLRGVSRWVVGVAPAVGAVPKTLANSLKDGLHSHRADHRWLRLIARILRGHAASDAWAYHHRSPKIVADDLARLHGQSVVDAGDAVLIASLVALWQQRRPTTEARGSRGHVVSRRATSKPIAALRGSLVGLGQLRHLGRLAHRFGGAAGQALWLLAVEAALTEAYLETHPPRRSASTRPDGGERWLREVDGLLGSASALIEQEELLVLRFRVDRMRAWRDGRPQPESSFGGVRSPYVRASLALERAYQRLPVKDAGFDPHTPGLLMLTPLLRRRELLVIR